MIWFVERQVTTKNTDEKLSSDVLEPWKSPRPSPVVLVPKDDNKWRVCVDFRKLNVLTKADKYPLLKIDEIIHLLAKQTLCMSTTDLSSGYWQIDVNESVL